MAIWCMHMACWIPKATHAQTHIHSRTHTLRVCDNLLFFHCKNGCKNAPQCYIICTLPVLLHEIIFQLICTLIHTNVALKQKNIHFLMAFFNTFPSGTYRGVTAIPYIVKGSHTSMFLYMTSSMCVCQLIWPTYCFKVIDSLMQDVWVSNYKQTDRS